MDFGKYHVSGIQIWAGNPGARDHIELQSCQNWKERSICVAEVCARGINKFSKLTILVPFWAGTDVGTKLKKLKTEDIFNFWVGLLDMDNLKNR